MTWILLIIIAILILLLFDHKRKTKLITKKLRDILYENSRERIKFNNLNRENKDLIKNINILLDRYQLISVDNKNYKEQHRKMISNISHDIRTPLTALMGYIELVKDDSISKEKREEYFDIIDERGNALRDLMEEFFQMAKIESKDMDINIEGVNISEVIRQNILTFMNDINKKEIIPKINIGEEEVFVLGDKKWIHRAIENVISNSLRYGYEGKVLGIDLEEGKNSVKLTIWDKGRGY
ncbi:sensor histidine kinase [Dethiothermospora halolimnae]|uniref:sensor histidine kinase n=1 Tax=Dethiothermospora halolimnae TaxID=3114390 RepID=UPI003CCC363F